MYCWRPIINLSLCYLLSKMYLQPPLNEGIHKQMAWFLKPLGHVKAFSEYKT